MSTIIRGFPDVSDGKESASNEGLPGSIPGSVRPQEKRLAIHSSILAWRIPWPEEPGGLQSMGSQRVGCDLTFSLFTIFKIYYVPCIVLSTLYSYLNIPRCVLQGGY